MPYCIIDFCSRIDTVDERLSGELYKSIIIVYNKLPQRFKNRMIIRFLVGLREKKDAFLFQRTA